MQTSRSLSRVGRIQAKPLIENGLGHEDKIDIGKRAHRHQLQHRRLFGNYAVPGSISRQLTLEVREAFFDEILAGPHHLLPHLVSAFLVEKCSSLLPWDAAAMFIGQSPQMRK